MSGPIRKAMDTTHRALDTSVSRRKLLAGAGAAGLSAAIYGGGMASASPAPGGGRVVRAQNGEAEYHAAYPYLDPNSGGHFNSFVTNNILPPTTSIYGDLIVQPMGMYYWADDEWMPLLATEWGFSEDGENFEVTLREGVEWSDGTPFTATDVVDTMWCLRIMSNVVWEYVDEVTAVDDHHVNFHLSNPSTVVERYVIRSSSPRPSAVYGEWAQRARDLYDEGLTMDDTEGSQLLDEFNQFRPDEILATGPYMIDMNSITNERMTLVRNENAWNADTALFDRIINFNGETDTISAVVLSGEIDYATHGFAPATEQQMMEQDIRVIRPPTYSGPGLYINYARHEEALGDKRARQAFAHIIDREQNGFISLAESGVPAQYMAGMADSLVETWVSDDDAEAFNQYGVDHERAAELLEEVGWTQEDGEWYLPNGERAQFELLFPAEFADWSAAGTDAADQLTAFGIEVTPTSVTHTQQPIDVNQGDFDLAIRAWGNSSNPHPHYSFTQTLFTHNTLAVVDGGSGMSFDLTQETDIAGEVDLEELTINSAEGLDEDEQGEQVTTIAQVFNELLPVVPLFERFGNNAALEGVRVESWPDDDDPIMQQSFYADGIPTMLMYEGRLNPAGGGEE